MTKELLWVFKATLKEYLKQKELPDKVINGSCFEADELPDVLDEFRSPLGEPLPMDLRLPEPT